MLKRIIVISLCVLLFACCTTSNKSISSKTENYKENALIIDAVTEFNIGNINKSESLFKNICLCFTNRIFNFMSILSTHRTHPFLHHSNQNNI